MVLPTVTIRLYALGGGSFTFLAVSFGVVVVFVLVESPFWFDDSFEHAKTAINKGINISFLDSI
jgi:hypothetical protein